jgi:C-terminal processing protease CtpA/Prc
MSIWSPPRRLLAALALSTCFALALGGCATAPQPQPPAPTNTAAALSPTPRPGQPQPTTIAGALSYTNDIFFSYATRHAVALVDLHGFAVRDPGWRIPADSLVFGALTLDTAAQTGRYRLRLPAHPPGSFVDVDHDGADDQVQIFTIAVWDDPLTDRDADHRGWPDNLASTISDPENHNEITGGALVVWAADASQQFPSGFGPDGRLFTADDPLGTLAAGYTLVRLDSQPFAFERGDNPDAPLHEQADEAIKDYSRESYSAAFGRLVAQLRREYAFNGIAGKAPDWDALERRIAPLVAAAEQRKDAQAFYMALHEFALAFHDGHVALDGGDLADSAFNAVYGGGYGFALRELDDGGIVVTYVLDGGPAAQAGMRVGAELINFDGRPAAAAAAEIQPWDGPFSTDLALRQARLRFLPRAAVGATARVTFANPGQGPASAALTAIDETDSLDATAPWHGADPTALPVEYWILDSGLGYVRINSNDDDLDLIDELFARALDSFDYHQVPGVIVDLRRNDGGPPQDLAGFLADAAIPLGQLEYPGADGGFAPDGERDQIEPIAQP